MEWSIRVIVQRHGEFNRESLEEVYWPMGLNDKQREQLERCLKKIGKEVKKTEYLEDALIDLADEGMLFNLPGDFWDMLVRFGYAGNILEAEEKFWECIENNREFNKKKAYTSAGSLTKTGREMTRKKALSILGEFPKDDTEFVFLHSTSEWLGWENAKGFGNRAKESLEEALNAICSNINSATELRGRFRIIKIGPDSALQEADIFYLPDAEDPKGYITTLRQEFGENGFWEAYYNMVPEFEPLRIKSGAESPLDLAGRLCQMVTRAVHLKDRRRNNDRLVLWAFSHGELIRSFLQHKLEMDEVGYIDFNEAVIIDISPTSNDVRVKFRDKEIIKKFEDFS